MRIETLEQALSYIPEYIYLMPKVDKWKEGDEIYVLNEGWCEIESGEDCVGALVAHEFSRRLIPSDIRLQEARWLLLQSLAPMKIYWSEGGEPYAFYTHHNWLEKNIVEALGGVEACELMATQGQGALIRWIVENRNG